MKKINPFECTGHPYYIITRKYMQDSFGVRAYYHLCHILNEMGYEAYISDDISTPNLRTPLLTPQVREMHRLRGCHPIAVYGEEIDENILGGDVVAWWIMNLKGRVRDIRNFGKDLVFYWTSEYAKGIESPIFLNQFFIDRRIFNKDNAKDSERNGFCWYADKYLEYLEKPVSEFVRRNGISICRDVVLSKEELANIFRRTKALYLYEESAVSQEAMLCGCAVAWIKTPYFDRMDTSNLDSSMFMDEKDIESGYIPDFDYAKFIKEHEATEEKSWKTLERFVDITQKAAMECNENARLSNLIEFCGKHEYIYIYGAGHWGKQCLDVLRSYGINVRAFIVSDDKLPKNNSEIHSLPILPLGAIENYKHKCGIIVAFSVKTKNEAMLTLKQRNFLYCKRYPLLA